MQTTADVPRFFFRSQFLSFSNPWVCNSAIPPSKAVPGALLSFGNSCFPMEEDSLASLNWEKMTYECRKFLIKHNHLPLCLPLRWICSSTLKTEQFQSSDSMTMKFSRFGVAFAIWVCPKFTNPEELGEKEHHREVTVPAENHSVLPLLG